MPALRGGGDAAVADGAGGAEDALQRVRGSVHEGPTFSRIPAGQQPDFFGDDPLQLDEESHGDAAAQGAAGEARAAEGGSLVNFSLFLMTFLEDNFFFKIFSLKKLVPFLVAEIN